MTVAGIYQKSAATVGTRPATVSIAVLESIGLSICRVQTMQTTRQVFDQLCREFDPRLARFRESVLDDEALLYTDEEVRSVRTILMWILKDKIAAKASRRVIAVKDVPDLGNFLGVIGRTQK
jgi:hypothetical protein